MDEVNEISEAHEEPPTFYELYVRTLLEFNEDLAERKYIGNARTSDELIDLQQAIDRAGLTERQAEALRLVYVEHLTHLQAGKLIGVPKQTIGFHVNAAIRKIAKIYEEWDVNTT